MLLAGSELTKEDRESQLYDEFERFKMLPGENINEYYVRFHKLVNDMRNIRMTMPNIQLNSKFVNNMSPEWDRFVTAVKLNKGLKETNHEQLYAYLKQHEKHAIKDRLIIEKITPTTNDQLAFVSSVQIYAHSSLVQSYQYPPSSIPLVYGGGGKWVEKAVVISGGDGECGLERLSRVFDGAFGGVRDKEVVVGEGVVVTSSSLEMLTNNCLGGIMVSLIFLEGLDEEALVEFMIECGVRKMDEMMKMVHNLK
ncbi:hypothetical protein Tco_0475350 [Tanacetum coccineum]